LRKSNLYTFRSGISAKLINFLSPSAELLSPFKSQPYLIHLDSENHTGTTFIK